MNSGDPRNRGWKVHDILTWCTCDVCRIAFLWKLLVVFVKSYIHHAVSTGFMTLANITRLLRTLVQNRICCACQQMIGTCRCAHQAQRRLSCDLTSLTLEQVLIMAVFIDESLSQLSGLLLFTFGKLFKGVPRTLSDILACAFMHLMLHAYYVWASYYPVICLQALLTG